MKPRLVDQAREFELMIERTGWTVEDAATRLALAGSSYRRYSAGTHQASERVMKLVRAAGLNTSEAPGAYTTVLRDIPLRLPFIPVLSKAHAGTLTSFEELPREWQEVTATTCRDEHAFGLIIQGDCMEPDFHEGEIAVLMPSSEPVSGDVVVARLLDDSVILRKYTVNDAHRKSFRLFCKNKDAGYKPLDLTWDDVVWLYPVHSAVRSVRR